MHKRHLWSRCPSWSTADSAASGTTAAATVLETIKETMATADPETIAQLAQTVENDPSIKRLVATGVLKYSDLLTTKDGKTVVNTTNHATFNPAMSCLHRCQAIVQEVASFDYKLRWPDGRITHATPADLQYMQAGAECTPQMPMLVGASG